MNRKSWLSFKLILWGIASGAGTGALDGVYQAFTSGQFSEEQLAKAAVLGAVAGAISYYKNPPKEKDKL